MSNSDLPLNEQDKTETHVVSSVSEDRGSRRLKGSREMRNFASERRCCERPIYYHFDLMDKKIRSRPHI